MVTSVYHSTAFVHEHRSIRKYVEVWRCFAPGKHISSSLLSTAGAECLTWEKCIVL